MKKQTVSEPLSIDFVLSGKLDGLEISPRTIGLSQFNDYNRQVEEFIAGSQKPRLNQVHVEIIGGSYIFRVLLPLTVMGMLEPDLKRLASQDVLGELDPKRAEVIQKWQARAKANPDLNFEVRPHKEGLPRVLISHRTDYRVGDIVPWVVVEKYLLGEVLDMGGAQKANIHLRLEPSGRTVIVGTSQGYLRDQVENRLYRKALLHVRAEQHFQTGELRNVQLISFVDFRPVYDEQALDRFAAEGAAAWADVPNAAKWVRELRGG